MKLLLVSQSDLIGGAARAAYRLHHSLLAAGEESRLWVRSKSSDDWTVRGPSGKLGRAAGVLRPKLGIALARLLMAPNSGLHSINVLPTNWAGAINRTDADVVNLHWVGLESMSIEDIGCIRKPIVWTLHDMWPFCGAEHYAHDGNEARWRHGYHHIKDGEKWTRRGADINRWVWLRKRRSWKRPMRIVCPSRWLASCAKESALMREWPISVVPYQLDLDTFKPLDRNFCRFVLNLPSDAKIILFGAIGGSIEARKGFDLLMAALQQLVSQDRNLVYQCVVFGQSEPQEPPNLPFQTHWIGGVHDDATLALLYSAADVTIVPSRQDNLPQIGIEAQACGCPVVAFNVTGLPDVVEHERTGYLARPFDDSELARGIIWVLQNENHRALISNAARKRALRLWAPQVVSSQYLQLFKQACADSSRT